MSLLDFLLRQIHITSEFTHLDLKVSKGRLEFGDYFSCQSFKRGDVNNLELLEGHVLGGLLMVNNVVLNFRQDSQQSYICLTGTCRGRDQ
jgi:hypothetical protein